MTLAARQGSCLCLLGIACLMVSTEARAESSEAKKRAFAEMLARRTTVEQAQERRATPAARKETPAAQPQLARVNPVATTNIAGIPPASPVAPTGYGFGRDAFVEALYSTMLGRPANESEVVYWDRLLVLGVLSPQQVADRIWFSLEHRTEQRNGTAPGIPLKIAYRQARAYGKSQSIR
jgi:hypothetical protein